MPGSSLSAIKRAFQDFNADFEGAPFGWIFLAMLAIAVTGNMQKDRELTRACGLLIELSDSVVVPDPQQQEIVATCMKPSPAE